MVLLPLLSALSLLPSHPAPAGWTAPLPRHPQAFQDDRPPGSSFSYRYVEAAGALGDLDGVRIDGTFHVQGPWIALGRFDYLTDDGGNTDVDLFLFSGGVGYVHTVRDDLDLLGTAELEVGHAEIDNPSGSHDDDDVGVRIRGGVRYLAQEQIELAGGLSYSSLFDDDLGFDVQALYAFNDSFSGFVGYEYRDDGFFLFGVRYSL